MRSIDGEVGWKDCISRYDAVCGFVSQSICFKVRLCFVQPLSLALLDSSPFGKDSLRPEGDVALATEGGWLAAPLGVD